LTAIRKRFKQNQTMSTSEYARAEALVNAAWIAELYENAWGVARDYGEALEWFQKAADAGNTDVIFNCSSSEIREIKGATH
jgi:TPR repeat protein